MSVRDASGNGNNGSVSATSWTTAGRYGGALSFNGTTSIVTVSDSASLHLSSGVTMEAWINVPAAPLGWQAIVFKEMPADGAYFLYRSGYSASPVAGVFTTAEQTITGANGPPLNAWTHVAFTYDGATERFYVNGVLVTSRAQTGAISAANGVLHIGGDSVWGEHFQGLIDEVRIYNRALTAAQIQSDMSTAISP